MKFLIRMAVCLVLASGVVAPLVAQTPELTRVNIGDRYYLGKPLAWDGSKMVLLRRDGKLSHLRVSSTDQLEASRKRFEPYSRSQMGQRLQKEFGPAYQVSATQHFLVVHPPGNPDKWAGPFQDLYWRFEAYFESRHVRLREPEFPLVAIVYRTREDFQQTTAAAQDSAVLGYYSLKSNRILTYDQSAGHADGQWIRNHRTLVHEAAHQSAFNSGIHSRYAAPVRWHSEGLAMLFEVTGTDHAAFNSSRAERINRQRLLELKSFYHAGQVAGALDPLISGDQLFQSNPHLAYALSWGLAFYLSESMPDEYLGFIHRDGQRPGFKNYPSSQQRRDFQQAFGGDLRALEARMKAFFDGLPVPSAD